MKKRISFSIQSGDTPMSSCRLDGVEVSNILGDI